MDYTTGMIEGDGGPGLLLEGPARPRSRWPLILGAVVVVVVLAAIAMAMFGAKKPVAAPGGSGAQVPTVSVIVPGRQQVDRAVSATGTLAAQVDMPVGVAGEGGRVTAVLVQPGDWVRAGQVLATVDRSVQTQTAASLAAQIAVSEADAKLAQAELERAQALVSRGFISKSDIDNKRATRDAAVARVKVARAQLAQQQATNGRLDIRSPSAGLVLTRQVEPGQIVGAGSGTLFRVAQNGALELRAQLSESDLAGIHVGSPARVTPVGSNRAFPGQVWQVSPVIDAQTRQGIARIALKFDPALRPGGFAAATLTSGSVYAPQLPNSAVQSDEKGNYVYVLDANDKVRRRDVTLGSVSDTGVAVASGLTGNEKVVLSAGAFLTDGQKIKPVLAAAPKLG